MDTFLNFARGTLSTGYDDAATSIVLTSGHGARFPSTAFWGVWWNQTDYPNPTDDPNREIVRVTARSTDTLTVTRGQQGISASTKNAGGKTYAFEQAWTAQDVADIKATPTNRWIPAASIVPRGTNGAQVNTTEAATNDVNYDTLDFDQTVEEGGNFWTVFPNNWNAGTITAKFHWTASSGSGAAVWSLAGRALGDDDAIDQAMGTAQTVADTLTATGDIDISAATSAITLAGTPANGKVNVFEVKRLPGDAGDTLTADARLVGIELSYTAA